MLFRRLGQNAVHQSAIRFGALSPMGKLQLEFVELGGEGEFERLLAFSKQLYLETSANMPTTCPDYELLVDQTTQYLSQFVEGHLESQFKLLKFWQALLDEGKKAGYHGDETVFNASEEHDDLNRSLYEAYNGATYGSFLPSTPSVGSSSASLRKGNRLKRLAPLYKQLERACFSQVESLTDSEQVKQMLELAKQSTEKMDPHFEAILIHRLMDMTARESSNPSVQRALKAACLLNPKMDRLTDNLEKEVH